MNYNDGYTKKLPPSDDDDMNCYGGDDDEKTVMVVEKSRHLLSLLTARRATRSRHFLNGVIPHRGDHVFAQSSLSSSMTAILPVITMCTMAQCTLGRVQLKLEILLFSPLPLPPSSPSPSLVKWQCSSCPVCRRVQHAIICNPLLPPLEPACLCQAIAASFRSSVFVFVPLLGTLRYF